MLISDVFFFFFNFFCMPCMDMKQIQIFTFLFLKENILGSKKIRVGAKN